MSGREKTGESSTPVTPMEREERSWEGEIDVEGSTDQEINDYIQHKINTYESNDRPTDGLLWESYQDDFETFTTSTFSQANRPILRNLQDYLRTRGV